MVEKIEKDPRKIARMIFNNFKGEGVPESSVIRDKLVEKEGYRGNVLYKNIEKAMNYLIENGYVRFSTAHPDEIRFRRRRKYF